MLSQGLVTRCLTMSLTHSSFHEDRGSFGQDGESHIAKVILHGRNDDKQGKVPISPTHRPNCFCENLGTETTSLARKA